MTNFENKLFYFGVIFDTTVNVLSYSKDQYTGDFLDPKNEKYCEYIVKVIETEKDPDIYNRLSYKLEITKVISQQTNMNKVGSTIWAYDDDDKYSNLNAKLSYNPECEVNDGGILNCSGCYSSLFIELDEFKKYVEVCPIQIKGYNVLVAMRTWLNDGKVIDKKISNLILCDEENDYGECDSDEEEGEHEYESSYYLVKKFRTFGYMKDNKFIKISDSENKIGYFLSFYLQ